MPEENQQKTSENKKIIGIIIVIIVLIIAILLILNLNKEQAQVNLEVYLPAPERTMEIGTVGSIPEGETIENINPEAIENPVRPLDLPIPNDIFNTAGTILKLQANSIVIRGNGTNFDDQIKRDITVIINSETTVNKVKGDSEYFKQNLKVGDEVVIEAAYNIHGKTELLASYINTIK